jgi:hypothetical protein
MIWVVVAVVVVGLAFRFDSCHHQTTRGLKKTKRKETGTRQRDNGMCSVVFDSSVVLMIEKAKPAGNDGNHSTIVVCTGGRKHEGTCHDKKRPQVGRNGNALGRKKKTPHWTSPISPNCVLKQC